MPRRASWPLVLLVAGWVGPSGHLPCLAVQMPGANPPAAAEPAESSQTTDPQIVAAIAQLYDADFKVRQRATRALWAAGEAAEPALRAELGQAGPEVAGRIRAILSNLAHGLTPDTSPEIIDLVARYRTGPAGVRRQVTDTLAQRGADGARVLLKLRAREQDPGVRGIISAVLLRRAGELAVSLIGDGQPDTAGELLAAAADTGDHMAALNYAAFLLVRGGLGEQIAAAQARLDRATALFEGEGDGAADDEAADGASDAAADAAALLTFLHRANGDLPAARAAAERSADDDLLHNILIEIGDWPELAKRADATAAANESDVSALGFAAAFHRLAGEAAGVDRFAALLNTIADREPHNSELAAEALFLNGRVDLGMTVLTRHNHLARAAEFHTQLLALDEVPALLERARARDGDDLRQVEARAARALWHAGDAAAAAEMLEGAAKGCERRRDFEGFVAVVGAANEAGLTERARWYTVGALRLAAANPALAAPAQDRDPLVELFARARVRGGTRAAAWWRLLRQRLPKQPAGLTLETVTAIDAKRMSADDLQALCDASARFASKLAAEEQAAHLELIADTLSDAGLRDAAVKRYEELVSVAGTANPGRAAVALSKLATYDAEAQRWQAAADRYLQAWSLDRAQPVPLYLSGWALAQAGDASSGKERMARARLLPLADGGGRHALCEAMGERKLADEARAERDAILRTAPFMSWHRNEALRRAGDDAHAAGKATLAADLWERAFLNNNDAGTKFIEPWANVSMPALIRRTRAVGLVRDGDVAAGLKEAEACLAMSPADADSLIEIVAALDAAGHKEPADAIFRRTMSRYEALARRYPRSGTMHNLCAWTAAKCKRDLDAALANAKRAVEIQPANTDWLDTLAEAHFARGELAAAISVMQRCAELEPDDPDHKERIEQFRQAAAAGDGR